MKSKLYCFVALLAISCGPPPDRFGQLDVKAWREDRGGCSGKRTALVPAFKAVQQNIKGKSANELGEMLGRPDINQILERNQKYYIYFLAKGPHCDKPGAKSSTPSVAIRMSAIGIATEITYQNGLP